jgi:hypothetical protein
MKWNKKEESFWTLKGVLLKLKSWDSSKIAFCIYWLG